MAHPIDALLLANTIEFSLFYEGYRDEEPLNLQRDQIEREKEKDEALQG